MLLWRFANGRNQKTTTPLVQYSMTNLNPRFGKNLVSFSIGFPTREAAMCDIFQNFDCYDISDWSVPNVFSLV